MSLTQLVRIWVMILVLMIAAVLLASAANATSYDANYGTYVGQGQDQTANGGTAVAGGGSSSAGAQSDAKAGSDVAVTGGKTSAFALGLPAPVHSAAVPGSLNKCVLSRSTATAVGWNFVSTGSSDQYISVHCALAEQVIALERSCQYRSAYRVRAALLSKLGVNLDPVSPDVRDLTPAECFAPAAAPVAVQEPAPVITVAPVINVQQPAPVVAPAPVVRKAVPARRKPAVVPAVPCNCITSIAK